MGNQTSPRSINGLPVKNGKQSILIHIDTPDIKKSIAKDPQKCPAATACYRELGCTDARVHVSRTYLRFNGHYARYHTSKRLRSEMIAYDRGGKFMPGTYELLKMQPSKSTGKRQGSNKVKLTKAQKVKNKKHGFRTANVRPVGTYA